MVALYRLRAARLRTRTPRGGRSHMRHQRKSPLCVWICGQTASTEGLALIERRSLVRICPDCFVFSWPVHFVAVLLCAYNLGYSVFAYPSIHARTVRLIGDLHPRFDVYSRTPRSLLPSLIPLAHAGSQVAMTPCTSTMHPQRANDDDVNLQPNFLSIKVRRLLISIP